jgi:hypothetical protein
LAWRGAAEGEPSAFEDEVKAGEAQSAFEYEVRHGEAQPKDEVGGVS